jgi:hypothetical protein
MRRVNLDNPLDAFLPEVRTVQNQEGSEVADPSALTGAERMDRFEDGARRFNEMSDAILVGIVGSSDNAFLREAATTEMQRRLADATRQASSSVANHAAHFQHLTTAINVLVCVLSVLALLQIALMIWATSWRR